MKKFLLLAFVLMLPGCATMFPPRLKAGRIWMYTQPLANYEKDPDVNFNDYKKFSVLPQAEINTEIKMNPIIEKQLLFMLRNYFESLGYCYVSNVKDADFLIAVYYSNEYKSQYIPPSSYTIPWYIPTQTQTTVINSYNTFSGTMGCDYFYGSGSGWATVTTTTPGHYVPMTVTRPGQYIGSYYPYFFVAVIDKNSKKIVWSGSVVGATSNPDIRLSAQVLFSYLFGIRESNFPTSNSHRNMDDSKDGVFGMFAYPYTIDGNHFYPQILAVAVGSPAYKEGLKPGDFIIKIDEESTLNWPLSRILNAVDKSTGESLAVTVKRRDNILNINLIAENEATARNQWKEIITFDQKFNIRRIKIPTSKQSNKNVYSHSPML